MSNNFNEDVRVKIPALIHLTRLGYEYKSRNYVRRTADKDTGILTEIFAKKIQELNPNYFAELQSAAKREPKANNQQSAIHYENLIKSLLERIKLELNYEDLGRSFFKLLCNQSNSEIKLIDLNNFHNNSFHCTTEQIFKNSDAEFRPDITVFINGIPIAIIEVKKPNNKDGIKAERERMKKRLTNDKFRRFLNEFQLFIFSNNQNYESDDPEHLIGAYYATLGRKSLIYNHFREELKSEIIDEIQNINIDIEKEILEDNNREEILDNTEYNTNKDDRSPTNQILTGLLSKNRLQFLLKHGIVYVEERDTETGILEIQKHIMRYPQIFATKKTLTSLNEGKKRGIIWHTQGSGKTAFSYYCVSILTEFYSKKGIIPKFYFIVDRLDLANQAIAEFTKRGLKTYTIDSKEELKEHFKQHIASYTGKNEICVINIQKFADDIININSSGYNTKIQRIFFIDEAHRSYKPTGSFLANFYNSDKDSIKIALTGTPLIISNSVNKYKTKDIFGDYIHKYYYNQSIDDGYTLRLMREEIETSYKEQINQVIKDIKVLKGDIQFKDIQEHKRYYEPLLDYIVEDLNKSRKILDDFSIGGMVVCCSNPQAKNIFELFKEKYQDKNNSVNSAILVLDDSDKTQRKQDIADFKNGKIDLVFVNQMLLTGFDCPRLKKLYLDRKIKAHNLLQALTRVNRPYKNFRFGYVVDFADIEEEFNKTNQAYLLELKEANKGFLNDDELDIWNQLFLTEEEINQCILEIKSCLFEYDLNNLENFRREIDEEKEKEKLYKLRKVLQTARDLSNLLKFKNHNKNLLDFERLKEVLNILNDRIFIINAKETSKSNSKDFLSLTIEDIIFKFEKSNEKELNILVENGRALIEKTRKEFSDNFDNKDPELITLYDEFLRVIDNQECLNLNYNKSEQEKIIVKMEDIYNRIKELNNKNNKLRDKYLGDKKYVRIDKRIAEQSSNYELEDKIKRFEFLSNIKNNTEKLISNNENILDNRAIFKNKIEQTISQEIRKNKTIKPKPKIIDFLTDIICDEYLEVV